jgi:hypothetical protein
MGPLLWISSRRRESATTLIIMMKNVELVRNFLHAYKLQWWANIFHLMGRTIVRKYLKSSCVIYLKKKHILKVDCNNLDTSIRKYVLNGSMDLVKCDFLKTTFGCKKNRLFEEKLALYYPTLGMGFEKRWCWHNLSSHLAIFNLPIVLQRDRFNVQSQRQ